MKKILFLIHDLGQGGAEKVLVNLVNHLDRSKFDISVTALFGGGVNEQFLKPDIHLHAVWPREIPGNSKLMKLLTTKQLHARCVREHYDIEVSYLEGPSARVISGCQDPDTRLVCWIHSTFGTTAQESIPFRSVAEAEQCYRKFDAVACVSQETQKAFCSAFPQAPNTMTVYNTIESSLILEKAAEQTDQTFRSDEINLITTGSLKPVKALDRLIRIHARLRREGYCVHTYLLGRGPDEQKLRQLVQDMSCADTFTFLGYDTNPYRYVAKSDLFVCCSLTEGFSTAATEALIVGTPVCTVEVSGMKEMLGEHNEYGLVTKNSEEALYEGVKRLLDEPDLLAHYRSQAVSRGKIFSTEETVRSVEELLETL